MSGVPTNHGAIDRRQLLAAGAAFPFIAAPGTAAPNSGTATQSPIAMTRHGPVAGGTEEGVNVFKGVRYGAPTGGANRFKPPQPPQPWSEPQPALEYGPAAPQSDPRKPPAARRVREAESEDCLKLNVWTPALRDGKKRPVMVWLHGGGLWRLSAAGPVQAGTHLCKRGDVVVVSPNHRLGMLGFAYLDPFGPEYAGAGSAGMLDLVQALQWVRDNIEEFGGDPGNVTIFGQSGGGQKISLLMAMPAAKGLFHRAAIQSGPAPVTLKPAYATGLARRMIAALGLDARNLGGLQTKSTEEIMAAYYQVFDEIGGFGPVMGVIQDFAPVVDGNILPSQPFWNGAPALSRHIPLLIGTVRTEMAGYMLADEPDVWKLDFDGVATRLARIFGGDAPAILAQYRKDHPQAGPWEVHSLIIADWPTRLFSVMMAEEQARTASAPVYMYRMDWKTRARDGLLMSPHACDIPFVMDTIQARPDVPAQDGERQRMADQMSEAWLAFARHGRPDTPLLPAWPRYDSRRRATMIFNLTSKVVFDPDGDDLRVLRHGLPHYRVVAGEA